MITKSIRMFGHPCILACDAKCHKAWGINNRPQIYLDDPAQTIRGHGFDAPRYPDDMPDGFDENNTVDLADNELPDAPMSSDGPDGLGTWEGGHGKPETPEERLNKWCARECERHVIVDDLPDGPVEDFELPDFSQRQYNIAPHVRPETDRG